MQKSVAYCKTAFDKEQLRENSGGDLGRVTSATQQNKAISNKYW